MAEKVSKEEFDRQVEVNQRKELTKVLGGLSTVLNKPDKDSGVAEALRQLVKEIREMPKPEKPEVNVEISNDEIVTSLQNMRDEICKSNERLATACEKATEALNNKLMVDEFEFKADTWGTYKTAKVIYKPMNQVTVKK